jgi:hypothetical protein
MTTTKKHTAGPWRVFDAFDNLEIVTDRLAAEDTRLIVRFKGPPNAKANARLMTAAPDLLDALETLVERDRSEAAESGFTDDEMSWLEDARRAIAKAKGGAS